MSGPSHMNNGLLVLTIAVSVATVLQPRPASCAGAGKELPDNRELGSIFNSDINGLFLFCSGKNTTPAEYKQAVADMLRYGMHVLAQNVGMPDPVIYRSNVATTWDKYHNQVLAKVWGKDAAEKDSQADVMRALLDASTDPLQLTIEACRDRGVFIVASYRMNAEDFYRGELDLYDFGRKHKNLAIPGANCLDPAYPEVYEHRMAIFREVAEKYDIDGIEFDFKRWYHMISNPHRNHYILTRMVRETRQMLDEVARRKGRKRLLLGVRVPASLSTPPTAEGFPGLVHPEAEFSCKDLGTDVRTWIREGLVDYVCPSLFWPRLPGLPRTREFAKLAERRDVGIYPTVFPLPAWAEDKANPVSDSLDARRRHRDEIVRAALQCYEEGADGISTFNWNRDVPDSPAGKRRSYSSEYGRGCAGYSRVLIQVHRKLSNRRALEALLKVTPPMAGLAPSENQVRR